MRSQTIAALALLVGLAGCTRDSAKDPTQPIPTDKQPDKTDHSGAADGAITTVAVAGNIHMLVGRGGNIGVSVGADGLLIIDDKFAPMADDIRAALKALGPGDLGYVLNTHHHGDHTGGNEVFGKDATIIAHDNVRKRMADADKPKHALPVITFDHSLSVHFNGEAIRAVHVPHSHTDGDSIIFFDKSNVVHMGDTFFNKRFPYIDLDSGGDPVQLLKSIRSVLEQVGPDTKIIPGHGDLASRADLELYARMLDENIATMRKHIAANKTLDQIKAAGVASEWASWGGHFIDNDRWLTILHKALSSTPKSQ